MTSVRWTPQASDDLQAIHDYIARDFEVYADAEARRILEAIDRLEAYPLSGRVVPEYDCEDIRELILPPYRIVYRYRDDVAVILTVFRAERLIPALPDEH